MLADVHSFKIKADLNLEKHLMKKIDEKVKNRLYKYLSKDKVGIRKYLLNFFLQMKSCTTVEIYDLLITQGFNINYRAVSAMVGHMHSRLGILVSLGPMTIMSIL